jgi:hypothetical protein
MSDIENEWQEFQRNIPSELYRPSSSKSELTPLVEWPSGTYVSWHYWKYLRTKNPYHGLHVSVMLEKYPDSIPKNLLFDCVYLTWIHSKNLNSRKDAFFKASNEFLLMLSVQQLNLICGIELSDCFVRAMAKSDSLSRHFSKASTFKKKYEKEQRENPILEITKLALEKHIKVTYLRPSDTEIDNFLGRFPSSSKIGIVGSLYD